MGRRELLSDQIRQAVDASGMSRYHICQLIDMDQSSLSRFMTGERGLTMPMLDRLADVLGLRVVTIGKETPSGGKKTETRTRAGK